MYPDKGPAPFTSLLISILKLLSALKRVLLINAEPISLFDNIDKILDLGLFLHIVVHHVLQPHVVIIYAHARDYRAEDSVCPTLMDSKGKAKRKRPPYDPELALAVSKKRKQHADLKVELENCF